MALSSDKKSRHAAVRDGDDGLIKVDGTTLAGLRQAVAKAFAHVRPTEIEDSLRRGLIYVSDSTADTAGVIRRAASADPRIDSSANLGNGSNADAVLSGLSREPSSPGRKHNRMFALAGGASALVVAVVSAAIIIPLQNVSDNINKAFSGLKLTAGSSTHAALDARYTRDRKIELTATGGPRQVVNMSTTRDLNGIRTPHALGTAGLGSTSTAIDCAVGGVKIETTVVNRAQGATGPLTKAERAASTEPGRDNYITVEGCGTDTARVVANGTVYNLTNRGKAPVMDAF